MKTVYTLLLVLIAASIAAGDLIPRPLAIKPDQAVIAPGYDRSRIEVKFVDQLDIGLSAEGVPIDRSGFVLKSSRSASVLGSISTSGGSWHRMNRDDEKTIDRLRENAEENLGRAIADLNNYFILTLPENITTEDWLDQLNSLDEVEIALAMPLPMRPPAVPPDFEMSQGYLNAAPTGIDAHTAWTYPGGTGFDISGQTIICDFEYSWNLNHNDFPFFTQMIPPALTPVDPFSDTRHGTAVMGEMLAIHNAWGIRGAVYGGIGWVAPTNFTTGWDIGASMLHAMVFMIPGGVFLIEQQMAGPNYTGIPSGTQDGLIPVEWWASWYAAIVTAIGNGIHVVEAAGNGREDLDDAVYAVGNGGHWPFLSVNNSGAIIVGAGAVPAGFAGSDVDRSRLWFSNYGSRVELQGWGERVATTGYGDLWAAEGVDWYCTITFGGTSSASPIVASAVGMLQNIYRVQTGGTNLSPATARSILISTGSPQQNGIYPISQHIGPRPDLAAAILALPPVSCCLNRGNVDGLSGPGGPIDVSDLTYLVAYLFNGGPVPPCIDEGNVDSVIGPAGPIDVVDLTYLVAYLFTGGAAPPSC